MTNQNSDVCAFCGKPRSDVIALVASQTPGIGICNECVMMAADLIIKSHKTISAKNRELRQQCGELQARIDANTQQPIQQKILIAASLVGKVAGELRELVVPTAPESVTTSPGSEEKKTDGNEAQEAGRGNEGATS